MLAPRFCARAGTWGARAATAFVIAALMTCAAAQELPLPSQSPDAPAGLPAAQRETLRLRLRQRLLADKPDGPFTLNARAWAVRGTVP